MINRRQALGSFVAAVAGAATETTEQADLVVAPYPSDHRDVLVTASLE